MKSRHLTNQPAPQTAFGLVAWLEQTRVALPLKGVECRFQVTGNIASVELDQIYHQDADRPLDCTYTFPLPGGAAVYRCEVHINGRIIRAKVEEKGAAREMYRTQKAAGRRTALVETERENLFTLSLGNVQPGDVIVVCFAWFQVLDRMADGLRLMVPTCPGIRYIPGKPLLRALCGRGIADDTDQVPDASRITPPRIDALHPDAAYFCITGGLSASDVESGSASSPSHPIIVREGEGKFAVELSGRAAVPDRDFVLTWKEPKVMQLAPQAWHWSKGEDTYVLVELRAPQNVKVADGLSQDFYFLVDRSGSMAGKKWQRTCEAVRGFVGLLGAKDRVWITHFESTFHDFNTAPVPARQVLADERFRRMEALGARGGTKLLPAATHVLEKIAAHSADRRTNVILITDGQVGNEEAVLRAFKPAAKVAVHTFGIDTAVNDAFLKSLARQQRGGCWLQTPDDDIAGTVSALGDRLRRPVLSNLAIKGAWETGDGNLPDLHAREVVTVALRGKAKGPIKVTGCLPDGTAHSFVVDRGAVGSEAVKLLWAQKRITVLSEAGQQQEAILLAKEHNLICEGAAFIAWDEQEQVPIAEDEIVQPVSESSVAEPGAVLAKLDTDHGLFAATPQPMRIVARSPGGFDGTPLFCAPSEETKAKQLKEETERKAMLAAELARKLKEEVERKAMLAARLLALREALREALQRECVMEPNIDRFIAWTMKGDPLERMYALSCAMVLIADARHQLRASASLQHVIRQVLNESPEALLDWADEFRPMFSKLLKFKRDWRGQMGHVLFEHLLTWFAELGRFDSVRPRKILDFLDSIENAPFSALSMERRWREFLDATTNVPY